MVSTRPPTSKSSRSFNNPLLGQKHQSQLVQSSLSCSIVFSILYQGRSTYPSFLHSFSFILWSVGTAKSTLLQILSLSFFFFFFFFLLIIIRSGLLAEIRWSVSMSKSHRSLCVSFSRTGAGLCIYHLFVWSNLNLLHISQWITLPTQSWLVLYSFCAYLLHSLMWLVVSSLSPHGLNLLFCWVLSILALIWLVLMALFCAAIRRDSVSLLKFPSLHQVQVFWREMLFISRLKSPQSCFSSYFCFLVILLLIVLSVLFLMAVISPRSCFSM